MLGIRTQGDLQHLSAGASRERGVSPLVKSGCSLELNVVEHEVHI